MEMDTELSTEVGQSVLDAEAVEGAIPSAADTVETVMVQAERPIMTTPLDDYSVTEGLLLLILLWLVGSFLWDKIRSVF